MYKLVLMLFIGLLPLTSNGASRGVTTSDHNTATKLCKSYGGYSYITVSKSGTKMTVVCVRGKMYKNIGRK
ncbi:hypothetical protein S140_11 [Shewanella sp. phage 1/40]|uniref:hypothetical protein n=1 Tax=Shewanella sp. phage 1/40 TaxID=1458860 RepID=UPI0004F8BE13|nr:hypothetical protein S140_11 [Shewanella sp. phage 1/40]AHK11421.1 hypothetical protein S140_11 [Shewanella sp. phage 1/40]